MPTPEAQARAGMAITVVLCTYNRCGTLATALDSLMRSQLPDSRTWEVLVVDNNSRDKTRDVVESFSRRYPGRIRYLFEPKPGKSYALNTGIENAGSDILAFVDDDVTVEPTWLHNLTAALHDGPWSGAGGRILPPHSFTAPSWCPHEWLGIICAHFDLGDQSRDLDVAPYGTNMAFRRTIFEKYGGFRTDLGPRPNCEIRNEDTEFGRRLIAAGERLKYEPSAVVYHPVPKNRLNKEYVLSWWCDYGRAIVREEKRAKVWGINRDYFCIVRCTSLLPAKMLRWMLTFNPERRFLKKCRLWYLGGRIAELIIVRFSRKRKKDDRIREIRSEQNISPA